MMEYEIRSRGDGADDDLDFLIARESSSGVMGVMFIDLSETGGGGDGIQGGVSKWCGLDL